MFSYLKGQADPDNQRPDSWSYTLVEGLKYLYSDVEYAGTCLPGGF
jgi:hypothetical protein